MFGLFKRHDVEMSPEIHGCITNGGHPVPQVAVVRSLMYEGFEDGKEQISTALTDNQGQFSFEQKIIKSRLPGRMFGENVPVLQSVYIEQDGHYHYLWSTSKSWRTISQLSALMLKLNGDLQHNNLTHVIDIIEDDGLHRHPVSSICQWHGPFITAFASKEQSATYNKFS
ncbi:DUF6795 domain-containing protein [Thalassomonas haliotis]|uniref:Carboxypeptidase regulatory-like domain-containing protein n=1 Tax=Thalassomonas haliotis TaxID=485448 RepID=A0ABY7VM45_9GAMM|nr:DUF6795 domain-containing protein [Thalassomonas haliotis]WDE14081.1 carboxypeptidase regulatory-like domain-containing protein [Thalassomonas haliotis]